MSETIAEKKQQEIEEFERSEKEDFEAICKDVCPGCGFNTVQFKYINAALLQFGLLECTRCGTVFCPESMRMEKLKMAAGPKKDGIIMPN